jgi:hypothetical protein
VIRLLEHIRIDVLTLISVHQLRSNPFFPDCVVVASFVDAMEEFLVPVFGEADKGDKQRQIASCPGASKIC